MKTPTYAPREMFVLKSADRVVARILPEQTSQWEEVELFPADDQTLRDKLAEVQQALAIVGGRIVLYVGCEIDGERMLANVPVDMIPEELER